VINPEGLSYTLFYASTFIFTGLAVSMAMQAGLFNIGAEGQMYIGGLGLAWPCWPSTARCRPGC
jgi:simple sugar transport system permease protein